jgi:hypothetical protein
VLVSSPGTTQDLIDAINTAEDISATLYWTETDNFQWNYPPHFTDFTACASRLLSALEAARDHSVGCPAAGVLPTTSPQNGPNTTYVQWVILPTISNGTSICPGDQSLVVTEVQTRLNNDLSSRPGISGVSATALQVESSWNRVRTKKHM